MQIREIIQCLESFAPLQYQEHYDNAGLLTGHAGWELTNALLTLDVTEAVIAEAIREKCNLIVSHHPIIWGGLKKINGNSYAERVVIKAIKADIAIYAAHTNIDNMSRGVSGMICEKLGLVRCKVLSPLKDTLKKLYSFVPSDHAEYIRGALFAAGAGSIGNYSECSFNAGGTGTFKGAEGTNPYAGKPGERHSEKETKVEVIFPAHLQRQIVDALLKNHPYEEVAYDVITLDNNNQGIGSGMAGELPEPISENDFLQMLKEKMRTGCIRHTALSGKKVKKVAVCGGAGSFLLKKAIAAGADVYVSADFKYHEFFDADNQIVIADIGHYESEQFTVELFYSILTGKFPNFAPLKSTIYTNPVNYLQ